MVARKMILTTIQFIALAGTVLFPLGASAQSNASVAFSITPNLFSAGQQASAFLSISSTGVPLPAALQTGDKFYFGISPSIGTVTSFVTPVVVNSSTLMPGDFSVAFGSSDNQIVITYNSAGKTFGYGDSICVRVNFTASAQAGSGDITFQSRFTHVVNGIGPFTSVTIVNFATGPAGPQGAQGPQGPQGQQGLQGVPGAGIGFNPLQVATLRWYNSTTTTFAFPVNNGTHAQELAFDGSSMWVSGDTTVTKLRASDGVNLGTFSTGGTGGAGVAFDGSNIWVVNNGSDTVSRLSISNGALFNPSPVGHLPQDIAFDGENMWVTNNGDNTVTRLHGTGAVSFGLFPVGNAPIGVAFDGANIWVANHLDNTVTKLRASDGANLGTFPAGPQPVGVTFDGANIWVANFIGNKVTKLRTSDGAILGSFPVGSFPLYLAFDGANIWVTNSGDHSVTKLRASDGANLGKFDNQAGVAGAAGVAFDGAFIWVAIPDEAEVIKR